MASSFCFLLSSHDVIKTKVIQFNLARDGKPRVMPRMPSDLLDNQGSVHSAAALV
jgi:hypothetical protein